MRKHTKVYYNFFDYSIGDFVPDEIFGNLAVDIHHIEARGMGGTKKEEHIDNLMALSYLPHIYYGDKTQYMEFLNGVHFNFMENEIPYIKIEPNHWAILEFIEKYSEFKLIWRKGK